MFSIFPDALNSVYPFQTRPSPNIKSRPKNKMYPTGSSLLTFLTLTSTIHFGYAQYLDNRFTNKQPVPKSIHPIDVQASQTTPVNERYRVQLKNQVHEHKVQDWASDHQQMNYAQPELMGSMIKRDAIENPTYIFLRDADAEPEPSSYFPTVSKAIPSMMGSQQQQQQYYQHQQQYNQKRSEREDLDNIFFARDPDARPSPIFDPDGSFYRAHRQSWAEYWRQAAQRADSQRWQQQQRRRQKKNQKRWGDERTGA